MFSKVPLLRLMLAIPLVYIVSVTAKAQPHPEWRGLLASAGFEGQSVKGAYFFPGEQKEDNVGMYMTHPLDPRDLHWNSDPSTRGWVMDRMVQAHINTVVMSYWSNMLQWSPMAIICPSESPCTASESETLKGVLDAVQGRPLVVMPAIEEGFVPEHPEIAHWEFSKEFPYNPTTPQVAPGLVERIGQLVDLFHGRMNLWARMYDRDGQPRYAVHLLHVSSDVITQVPGPDDDRKFADAFDYVAAQVKALYDIPVGFTLDTIVGNHSYSADPREAGAALEQTPSVLAVQGFASEVISGPVIAAPPCSEKDWHRCDPPAHDNNKDNIELVAKWKSDAVRDWIATGVPVILDVSNGFDGRDVWKKQGAAFWGDNLDYTDDRWRNWMSELKGPGVKGITFDTWNGYTEGYAAVPSIEHGWTVYNWLTDLLQPPPWVCSHMHYVNGAPSHRVYGAICEKWVQLGADRSFGAPVSEELPGTRGRVQYSTDNKAIYWGEATGAHEVHGLIEETYREAGADASCLGLPVSDEQASSDGRVLQHFEHGQIDWIPGDTRGRITCR